MFTLIHGDVSTLIEEVSFTCYGPFPTAPDACSAAEVLRESLGLPGMATPENNEVWTDAGHWFGIVELKDSTKAIEPRIDVNGFAMPIVKVTLRAGRELYLCNTFTDIRAAIATGQPFTAHAVKSLQAKPVVLNPAHIALTEDLT